MQTYNPTTPMRFIVISILLLFGLAGCGSNAKLRDAPVSVTGTVSQSGQPIGGVVMVFQPLGDGQMREMPVRNDGTFNGELVSGQYAYFVAKPAAPAVAPPPKTLAPKYLEADMSRTVTVEPGKQLAIALD